MFYLEIRSRPMWDVVEWLSADSACNLVLQEYTLVRYFCLWAKLLSGPVFWLNLEHNVAWSHIWYLRNAIWWSHLVLWDSAQHLLPSLWWLKQHWKGFRDYLWVSPPGALWQMVNCSNVCMYVLNPSPDCNLQMNWGYDLNWEWSDWYMFFGFYNQDWDLQNCKMRIIELMWCNWLGLWLFLVMSET